MICLIFIFMESIETFNIAVMLLFLQREKNGKIDLQIVQAYVILGKGGAASGLKAICFVGDVVEAARANDYTVMIIADHGNADNAVNEDGSPNTAHSLNPVPCILVTDEYTSVKDGILADVAPTLLKIMDLEIPEDMTGTVLV